MHQLVELRGENQHQEAGGHGDQAEAGVDIDITREGLQCGGCGYSSAYDGFRIRRHIRNHFAAVCEFGELSSQEVGA